MRSGGAKVGGARLGDYPDEKCRYDNACNAGISVGFLGNRQSSQKVPNQLAASAPLAGSKRASRTRAVERFQHFAAENPIRTGKRSPKVGATECDGSSDAVKTAKQQVGRAGPAQSS